MERLIPALLLCTALLSSCASTVQVAQPPITQVEAWGGSPTAPPALPQNIQHLTWHHQGEIWKSETDPEAYLRRLQQWSRLSKRWADIPYHYVIAPDGRIFAARPVELAGDTNTEYNPSGHALVMLLGNFEEQQPTPAQLESAVGLSAWLLQKNGLGVERLASHRDFSQKTVCPGKNLYSLLQSGWVRSAVQARLDGKALPPL